MARRKGPNPRDIQQAVSSFLRLSRPMQLAVLAILIVAGIIVAFGCFRNQPPPSGLPAAYTGSPHLLLGNPSGATADAGNKDNYLMVKPQYALSYNNTKATANWVSWRLTKADLGQAARKQSFDFDNTLPSGFVRVTHKDYSNSGFDRGHLCPHADRAASQEAAWSTFVMTNIIPQAPNVNEKAWANLENYCRDQVRRSNRAYIIAGPTGRGGRGENGFKQTIASGKVAVPGECWKVIVIVPESGGDNDLARIDPATRVITVNMPNDNDQVGEDWARYRTTPARVEERTGLSFFGNLAPEVAAALRHKVDSTPIPQPR